jgi:hypothetical protein
MTKAEAVQESSSKSNVLGSCATCNGNGEGGKGVKTLSSTPGEGKFVPSNPSVAAQIKMNPPEGQK